ncbi:endoribonuclease Dicer-like [Centruroides sculpturatus]|uniref:endoribonuclease Dicer-like n=1 Tax=Centruroides sculpturatus TaxID=218467 RepID=UPI000C6DABCC|nr:endoribonuclease Dicer-like [Centruroides sculpturatus]
MESKIPESSTRGRRQHLVENVNTKTFTPREYQLEILDAARKKNVIACLGTGAGKTFIAIMLIKELAHQIRNGEKNTVFLAPTAPLVKQQKQVISDYTDLKVGAYCGRQEKHESTLEFWANELKNVHVLVMTPDIFRMIVCHNLLPLSRINLLIIDECHKARKAHPYREVMRYFDLCKDEEHPRILGLSASLLNNKCKPTKLEEEIKTLEDILKSTVVTASDLMTAGKYGTKPDEHLTFYDDYKNNSIHFENIMHVLHKCLDFIKDFKCPKNDKMPVEKLPDPCKQPKRYLLEIQHVIITLGPWCAVQTAELFRKEISYMIDNIESKEHKNMLIIVNTTLHMVIELFKELIENENDDLLSASPKLKELLKILTNFKPSMDPEPMENKNNFQNGLLNTSINNQLDAGEEKVEQENKIQLNRNEKQIEDLKSEKMCGIVFVKERITAHVLNLWLTEISKKREDFKFISSNFIYGHNQIQRNCATRDATMSLHKQEEILYKFRNKEYNLLIATSVVEEGLDVPKCNLVIRFDRPEEFRSYIQSKGRARAQDSKYFIMVSQIDRVRFIDDMFDFQTIESILQKKCYEREIPVEDVDDKKADQMKPAYRPNDKDGAACVLMSTSIPLVNRYCVKLPSDTFTKLTPKWKIKEIFFENSFIGYQCIIRLPINSPMKIPVNGDVMPKKQLAKMAAALKTCELLHKAGELDDNLLPTGKEAVKFEEEMIGDYEEVPQGAPRPGTTKRRQYYFKQIAEALRSNPPEENLECFLYMFSMKLTCPIPEEQNTRGRKIHDPAETTCGFGLITTKQIPPICSFPVFTRSGEVTIKLEFIQSNLTITKQELEKLAFFHKYTFADVLRLEKYPMLFNPNEARHSFFIIPVDKDPDDGKHKISWEFVDIINKQKQVVARKIPEEERKNFMFCVEKYKDAVVMPWYRNLDKPQFFYVAEICENLTPKSDFPDAGYETFEGYYRNKYGINIMNGIQPLLDVDHTSARLNLLTPRYVNRKGVTLPTSSEQTKKAKRENLQQKQILVPELCIIHPFPASLWRKAVCLPCILYRVNSLLLAEQLRLTVAKEIGVGTSEMKLGFEWPMLDFGWTLADVLKAQAAADEKEAQKVQNIKPNEIISSSNLSGERENFPIGTWSNEMAGNKNNGSDFVIDTFDPSKVHIPDDDDFLADQEVSKIQFDDITGNVSNFDMWGAINPPEVSSPELFQIRYGSPSNFEGTGWDSEWDTETEDANFYSLNLPGLGYISAPGVFNMEGLSLDLASCRDDDLWDSMDEDSIYDETELEKLSPIPQLTFQNGEAENLISNKLTASEYDVTIYESEWISSNCNIELDVTNSSLDNSDDELEKPKEISKVIDPSISETPNEITDDDDDDLNSENKFLQNDVSDIPINLLENELCIIDHFHNSVSTESTLAFGDLLPDREKLQFCDKDIFRVHFDENIDLNQHNGPSPSIILQALTMSNANDGINLERLETVGDSFLKYAITAYLFCTYPNLHEGKLSYLRSKQISNLNLYRLGKKKGLGELMVATKFEPNDNWLPPCYTVPKGLEQALIESGTPSGHWNIGTLGQGLNLMNEEQIRQCVLNKKCQENIVDGLVPNQENQIPYIPYNLLTQHSIPDKSIADCVEALIGAYLISCGPRGALLFMSWLKLRVLPNTSNQSDKNNIYGNLEPPQSPLLKHVPNSDKKLDRLLSGYASFEKKIGYNFKDKAYLLQAFTHASYHYNQLTDCYQRLEFLGDAVLDYLITRHLYEDPQKHSPGTLTDLRSALVNNTFFASLAVKYDFHKYFKAISPGLFGVINKFVEMKKKSSGFDDCENYYLEEEECEEAEEVEVPKALGDVFESVAGAIYLDSGMSLDCVWRVYYAMMKPEIEFFSTHVPKSPIRELLEMEPQTAKFERAEMTMSGKVRVRVEVFGKGQFVGIGRNKRIAKCTAAKRALRELKKMKKAKSWKSF